MPKIKREWKLPKPDKGPHTEWIPIVRVGIVTPFGYEEDPNDRDILLPIEKELVLLEEAKKLLKYYSSREVAEWLSKQSGRSISHTGLLKRVKIEHKRQRALSLTEYYARRYKEASEKAEKIRARPGGTKKRESTS